MAVIDLTARKKKEFRKRKVQRVLSVLSTICSILNFILVGIAVTSVIFSYVTDGEVSSIFTSELASKQFVAIVTGLFVGSCLSEIFE